MRISYGLYDRAIVGELGDAVSYAVDDYSFDAVDGAQAGVLADVAVVLVYEAGEWFRDYEE